MTTMTGSEWLLYRAFSMAEDNCKTPGWQKMIRTGYEVSRLSNPDHPDKHDRIGDDGQAAPASTQQALCPELQCAGNSLW